MPISASLPPLRGCGQRFPQRLRCRPGRRRHQVDPRINPGLEGSEAFWPRGLLWCRHCRHGHRLALDRAWGPQQLIDGHSQGLTLDVPQRLLDATQGAGKDWATPVEGVSIEGLPVVDYVARVLADQVRSHFGNGGGTGFGTAFSDGLSQADDAVIGVNLEEQPPGLNEQGLEFGDANLGQKLSHSLACGETKPG